MLTIYVSFSNDHVLSQIKYLQCNISQHLANGLLSYTFQISGTKFQSQDDDDYMKHRMCDVQLCISQIEYQKVCLVIQQILINYACVNKSS